MTDPIMKEFNDRQAKWKREEERRQAAQERELIRSQKKFPKLEGFEGMWSRDRSYGQPVWKMVSQDQSIELIFRPGGDGTTRFTVKGQWRDFDRLGVSSSFYWSDLFKDKVVSEDLKKDIDNQLRMVADKRKFFESAISIPVVGYSVSPEGLENLKKELKSRGFITFTPSGFGTGKIVATKPQRFGKVAPKELQDFFGISPLFLSTFDCD
jgi:hypothetical protein